MCIIISNVCENSNGNQCVNIINDNEVVILLLMKIW